MVLIEEISINAIF